jgi:hypothetical protein
MSGTSLGPLSLPYPFSQVGLLSASEFVKLGEERRSRVGRGLVPPVNEQVLEELQLKIRRADRCFRPELC